MGALLWAGLRQVQALRDSLCWTLGGAGIPKSDQSAIREWLQQQGCERVPEGWSDPHPTMLFDAALNSARDRILGSRAEAFALMIAAKRGAQPLEDFGAERSGAGWQRSANFTITSAFVRTLGALEQLELDVLKSLFYYRPSGALGHPADQELIEVDADVAREMPLGKRYSKPVLWTWLKAHAERKHQRRQIFKEIYGIETLPLEYAQSDPRGDWDKKRNAIAHGHTAVTMTLGEYAEVDVYVCRVMKFIAEQCEQLLKVVI